MTKPFLLSISFVFVLCHAMAQESDVALASIRYELVHVNDTNDRENPRKEEMTAFLGQHASVYRSQAVATRRQETERRMAAAARNNPSEFTVVGTTPISALNNTTSEELFFFQKDSKLILSDNILRTTYAFELPTPHIDWEIGEETREIGGYLAQEAKGSFGGRDYTVWFATDLPFPYGPWKLAGLPGLILEAADSRNEVFFNFRSFEKLSEHIAIALPENAIKTNLKNFEKAKESFESDPIAYGQSASGGTGMMVRRDGAQGSNEDARAVISQRIKELKAKNNNPLELTEN